MPAVQTPANTGKSTRAPTVSLGMPVCNGESFIAEAIQSILEQSFGDLELIICDNASTDRTGEICRSFAATDPRVRYFRNPENLGAHPNFNLTFRHSRGRFFKWVPHDDVLHPEYLESCLACLEATPGAVLCQSDIEYVDGAGSILGVDTARRDQSGAAGAVNRFAAQTLMSHNCYDIMGLFRRDALAGSKLLESFHGADRALLAQLAILGPSAHVSRPLLRVRDHPGRYTRARKRPQDRAQWHDTRNAGRRSFPTWRLYANYWHIARTTDGGFRVRMRLALVLLKWWFVNWNWARMLVDLVASVAPDIVGSSERIKQRLFSPAPGIDRVKKSRSN